MPHLPTRRNDAAPLVVFVGGQDISLRIPMLQRLAAGGYRVAVVGSEAPESFVSAGLRYESYPLDRSISPSADVRVLRRLSHIFSNLHPTIVHAFDTKPGLLAPIASRRRGVPITVRTVTGMGRVFSSTSPQALAVRPLYRVLQRTVRPLTDALVFQNSTDLEYFLDKRMTTRRPARLIPGSGVDPEGLRRCIPPPSALAALRAQLGIATGPVVTMASRIIHQKGVLDYCRAAEQVRRTHPNCQFLLIGPRSGEGRHAVPETDLQRYAGTVLYLGPRSDLPALLALSDVFVLPTIYREGIPRVLLEAGALGVPLIATDVPGCREVVHDGETGLRVKPQDVPSLAAAIEWMLDNPERRVKMGRRAQHIVASSFSLERVSAEHIALYDQLVDRRSCND